MKTMLDLPEDLMTEIKHRAIRDGKNLKESIADLLRRGLRANESKGPTVVKASRAALKRRKEMTQKFVDGEWGLELAGFEDAVKVDQTKTRLRANAWRD